MHWIALQPELVAGTTGLTDPVTALGWWALRYTPKVVRVGDVVLMEVAASARLWGGMPALLQHIIRSNKPVALDKYAQAATSLIALAQLDVTPSSVMQPVPTKSLLRNQLPLDDLPVDNLPVDNLPLHALAAAKPHLDTLARLGVSTWGQLRALPRGGITRRFGAPLLDALDQAYGLRPDLYPWLVLPEVFEAALELSAQVESAPALLFAARRLLAQLKVWLQLRHRGVLALELMWQMDERRHTAHQGALVWRTAQPTQDSTHLQRLLGEHLAHVRLPAPAHTLRLRTVETAALGHTSASLLPDAQSTGDSLTQMLERLSARLGAHQVLQMQPRLDHRPEQMQAWLPFATHSIASNEIDTRARVIKRLNKRSKSGRAAAAADQAPSPVAPVPASAATTLTSPTVAGLGLDSGAWAQALAPTWLLPQPLRLVVRDGHPQYQGVLTLLAGPQRLESGWWGGGDLALRDYFVARSSVSGLLWIYRERLNGADPAQPSHAWYVHGLFA